MKEDWSPTEIFSPILIENYIRFETAAQYIKALEEGASGDVVVSAKFKISKAYFEQLKNSDNQAPLLGLTLDYDESTEILTVTVDAYFKELYENKIMRDVALKQCEDCKERYSKFISLVV